MDFSNKKYGALVLAAGKGTRMHSPLPKVLHCLLGEPMLKLVLDALNPIFNKNIWTVVGHQAGLVKQTIGDEFCYYILQKEQLGTGHALREAAQILQSANIEYLLVVNGDVPLIETVAIKNFMQESLESEADLSFMSMSLDTPGAYGRVLRNNNGKVTAIMEAKDYNPELHGPEPKEINTGIYFLRLAKILPLLDKIKNTNKSGEYYITDLISLAVANKLVVIALEQGDTPALLGANNPLELVQSESLLQNKIIEHWLRQGVLIRSPETVRIGPAVKLEPGAEICGPCEIYGKSHIAVGASISAYVWASDIIVASGARIRPFCHLESANIGANCTVGPYARLRPGAVMEEESMVGNFVEIKKARLGKKAKASHLTYLGDAEVGAGANIGAGTITCNYDGKNKHKTTIEAGAFIGSNSALVAPVTIGEHALVGAGSVITKDVPANTLAIARARQKILPKK